MPNVNLDAQFVRDVVCSEGRSKTDYYDNVITGFILEVRATGGKTYSLRYRDPHGKQRQHKIGDAKSITFDKARQAAEKLRAKVVLGEDPYYDKKTVREVPTLSQFITDKYLPHMRVHRRNFQSTISFLNLHIVPRFGHLHLDSITSAMVEQAHGEMRSKGYAAATSNKLPILLKIIFNLAGKLKVHGASKNPANGIALFQLNNAKERYLTSEETARLHEALDRSDNKQLKYIVALMLMFGCRKRELLDAKWDDFDLERKFWRISTSKTGKARTIPISYKAWEILQQLPRWDGCVYVVPNPKTLKPFANLFCCWNTARKRAGLSDVRMHDLRHSFASNLVNAGQSMSVIGKLLGHSQLKTTQRYAHLSDATLLAAVDVAANAAGAPIGRLRQVASV
ncbi:tyrosine-type recombinase/integrase [Acidovorax sp. NPDC077693]|uniref:tyrosine-type recombinase/integrase n=1 Tax=unclassified Acidovorax TaxID=2684926 RepID=UPI0037C8A720